jgi:prophage regulatory protein
MNRFVRMPELLVLTGLSASTIYRLEKRGQFPRRIRLAPNSVGWRLKSVQSWIESRTTVTSY